MSELKLKHVRFCRRSISMLVTDVFIGNLFVLFVYSNLK